MRTYRTTCPLLAIVQAMIFVATSPCAYAENIVYPADAGVIDVTKPPYNAKGDGKTDDTQPLQRAINDYTGTRHIIYIPNGTYHISKTLLIPFRNPQGNVNYGNTHIQGQSRDGVILRLSDNTFTAPTKPAAMLDSGAHGSADWFANSVRNLSFHSGKGNPGAIGLRFFSNNTGCVRDVAIRSADGQGVIGLDLGYNDMNGPLLVKNMRVEGFKVGVQCGASVNSQTFSTLSLANQSEYGLRNGGQCISIEGIYSSSPGSAVVNRAGQMVIYGGRMSGKETSKQFPAISNSADIYVRDVRVSDYGSPMVAETIAKYTTNVAGQSEFISALPIVLFPTPPQPRVLNPPVRVTPMTGLNLPVQQTPEIEWDEPKSWASPFGAGAKPNEGSDISEGLQKAIDSGATTVYIPTGAWKISKTIFVRGKVRRIVGMNSYLIPEEPVNSQDAPFFQIETGTAKSVLLEGMSFGFGWKKVYGIQNNSSRTLILRDMEIYAYRNRIGAGTLFLENVVGGPFVFTKQTVYARQLNQETEGTHITNDGGSLWILGLKTERGGTLIETINQGKTEVLGGLCYTTTAGKLAPMFVNRDSSVSVTLGERCYSGDPYTVIVSETQNGQTRTLLNSAPEYKGRLVLYSGRAGNKQ